MRRNQLAMRWLSFALLLSMSPVLTAAQQERKEVAITVDDLPEHGALPAGVTRTDVAKSMIAAFKAKGVPEVYGFINAKKIGDDADRSASLKVWVDAGLPLASHTYLHIDLTTHSAEEL